ncbi:hypothetical protein X801_04559, partial [Opisthorchis viverrini]
LFKLDELEIQQIWEKIVLRITNKNYSKPSFNVMSRIPNRDWRRRVRNGTHTASSTATNGEDEQPSNTEDVSPNYRFYCQLAHGSPTGIIEGFRTVRELHAKIAECFDLDVSDIMYCTLNTHKVDVDKVIGHEIGINDFLFAHVRGQPKEITIRKESDSFGMTVSDTGCGVVFIKRIQPGGQMAHKSDCCGGMILVGDQIERINNISFIGRRHYEVAAYMRSIPVGNNYVLRIVSPLKSPIYALNSRYSSNCYANYFGSGKRTIRLHTNGGIREHMVIGQELENIQRVNSLLGYTLGFEDDRLACLIYTTAIQSETPRALADALCQEQLMFSIPSGVLYEAWNLVNQPYTTVAEPMDNLYSLAWRLKRRP